MIKFWITLALGLLLATPAWSCGVALTRLADSNGRRVWHWNDPSFQVDLRVVESGDKVLDRFFLRAIPEALCLLREHPDYYRRLLTRKANDPSTVLPNNDARVLRILAVDKGRPLPMGSSPTFASGRLRRGATLADYSQGVVTFFPEILRRPFFQDSLFLAGNLVHEWMHKEQTRKGLDGVADAVSFMELHADLYHQHFLATLPEAVIKKLGERYTLQLDHTQKRNAETIRMMGTRWFSHDMPVVDRLCLVEIYLLEERFRHLGFRRDPLCDTPQANALPKPQTPFIPELNETPFRIVELPDDDDLLLRP